MFHCLFPSLEMKNTGDFSSLSGRSVSKGGTLLPRVGFTAPSEARAVTDIRGHTSWNKSLRDFYSFLMLDGTFFCSIPSSFDV